MWAAFNAGRPIRTPVVLGVNTRYFMVDARANPHGLTFQAYTEDPDLMFDAQLAYARWSRLNLLQDAELGTPARWTVNVDFQNYYEASWFGCPVTFPRGEVPDAQPGFADCPERVMESGLPDPFGGLMGRGMEYYEYFVERAVRTEYHGRPVSVAIPWFGLGTDGPMTVACSLFGPLFVCTAMASEPERLQELLRFITEATIRRMAAWRARFNIPVPQDGFGMADDSIALISTAMYREHVMPHHRRIFDHFGTAEGRSIHLCGDSTRHFRTIVDCLGVRSFDTGFPVDFARLRKELGPDVRIQGGPHVELLRTATPGEVMAEARRILESGIMDGGRFVLREGNNLAPGTPLENTEALYAAGKLYGRYPKG